MYKHLLLIGLLVSTAGQNFAQDMEYIKTRKLNERIKNSQPDTNRIKLFWNIGRAYLLRRGDYPADLDSASLFFQKAVSLSDVMVRPDMKAESICRIGEAYLQTGKLKEGINYFKKALSYYQTNNNKEKEAETFMRMGYTTYRESSTYGYFYSFPVNKITDIQFEIINWFEQARSIYRVTENQVGIVEASRQIADIHLNQGKLDTAEIELLDVLAMYKSIGFKNLHYTYDLLSVTNRLKGNYNKALYYSMEAIKSANSTDDNISLSHFYLSFAHVYHELGQLEKSIEWYKNALEIFKTDSFPKPNLYRVAGYLSTTLIEAKREKEVLPFLLRLNTEIPPYSILDKEINARSLGDCYNALRQYPLAEKYYLQMIEWDNQLNIGGISSEVYYIIGKFYVDQRRYDKATAYLQEILKLPSGIGIISIIKDTRLLLFKTDSASGNYYSAIKQFQQYKLLNDSIFNEAKSRQIEELQIQYQTVKNEENIKLLHNQALLQRNKLKQAKFENNITIGGLVMLLLVMALLFNRYRLKQRSNKQLELSQAEIHQKNETLQSLNTGQQKLIAEKEWLLKEVHHRVKNNLQTVLSLLESQSAFLKNEALVANLDSQHRVYSMSLIHQKLYQSESVTSLDMSVYIPELVNYLRESLDSKQTIKFSQHIESIMLNVTQAVAIGIISTEAITNSIKYAFPDRHTGVIEISMNKVQDDMILLSIADNGIGIHQEKDLSQTSSLGMRLMQGLSDDIHGQFEIQSREGTRITVTFKNEEH